MKKSIIFLFLCVSHSFLSQFNFHREVILPVKTVQWFVDPLGNHYAQENNKLSKLDTLGKVQFSQAIKSQGEISQLVFNSAQKVIAFSEEQQQICIFDNTLTPITSCLNLDDFSILNATAIASSSRANSVWIYDRVNSSILQLDTDKKVVYQQLKNITGLIGFSGNISYLKEEDEQLWISDGERTFSFDLNLNLMQENDFSCGPKSFIKASTFFEFGDNAFFILDLNTKKQGIGENPVAEAEKITYSNGYFYFQKGNKILLYKIG